MRRQSKLVLLLLLSVGVFQVTLSAPEIKILHDDIQDNELNSDELLLPAETTSSGLKISTPKFKEITPTTAKQQAASSSTSTSTSTSTTERPHIKNEVLNDLIEAAKHNKDLADDPRFNKMLPETKNRTSTASSEKKKYEDSDEDYYEYDYEYDDDDNTTTPNPVEIINLKKNAFKKTKEKESEDNYYDENEDMDDILDDDDEEDDEDDEDDDRLISQSTPCPRYCVCARNINSYLVATCSRLDTGTQKFGADITDLVVTDVGPKYPILLGPKFFLQMGLKNVASIKISNCTIEYLHEQAFHGLDELYSVNLTNVGLAIINPDTFSLNKKLRMLTISGNDLSIMSSVHYMLKSTSLEELDLSRNNLMELNPNAFVQLSNIVYINLSQNNLQAIPDKVFDAVATIEELDLSYNSLKSLPANIFNRTALAILHLKYNFFTGDLSFGTNDLQQLDLSFNTIHHINNKMFEKMSGLTNLNLKGNGISKITADSFMHLKNLRHIDLSINELDQVSGVLFYRNSELDVIKLNDNPRLSRLPTDGFVSSNGYFTVYYLDISNCALGALGHNTFSNMPHLATLKLAWNNINNLEADTFAKLYKLNDLDLSNNLISKLHDTLFLNNNYMTKLNLAGNPIRKLPVQIFKPFTKLRELDVSDCELHTLLSEPQVGIVGKYKFFDSMININASHNHIKKISSKDIQSFAVLNSLDITHNPLKCNEDFQDFIKYVSLKGDFFMEPYPHFLAEMDTNENAENNMHSASEMAWATFAEEICKHTEGMKGKKANKENKLNERLNDAEKVLDQDAKDLLSIMEKRKLSKLLEDSRDNEDDLLVNYDVSENEDDNANENLDDDEEDENDDDDADADDDDKNTPSNDDEDEDDYDDDNEDEEDEATIRKKQDDFIKKIHIKQDSPKDDNDKFLWDKIPTNAEDDDNYNSDEEEIYIERGHVYYSGYKFLIPLIILVTCVIVLLLAIAKVVSMIVRKRGERYRMALLASSNNSIVYQKLSEDIVKPKERAVKYPKVHQYAPINSV